MQGVIYVHAGRELHACRVKKMCMRDVASAHAGHAVWGWQTEHAGPAAFLRACCSWRLQQDHVAQSQFERDSC